MHIKTFLISTQIQAVCYFRIIQIASFCSVAAIATAAKNCGTAAVTETAMVTTAKMLCQKANHSNGGDGSGYTSNDSACCGVGNGSGEWLQRQRQGGALMTAVMRVQVTGVAAAKGAAGSSSKNGGICRVIVTYVAILCQMLDM